MSIMSQMANFLGMSGAYTHTSFREVVEEIVDAKLSGRAPPLPAGVTSLASPSTDGQSLAQASLVRSEGVGRLTVGATMTTTARMSCGGPGSCSFPPRQMIRVEAEPHVRWEGERRSQDGVTDTSHPLPTCAGVLAAAPLADGSLLPPPPSSCGYQRMGSVEAFVSLLIFITLCVPFRGWVHSRWLTLLTHHSY